MTDYKAALEEFKPAHGFFVGIDSDGCAFDSMELKHKECFCPNYINYFGLQAVSKYARECWDFVNLYSDTRGCNRFLALIRALDRLRERPEVQRRGVEVPRLDSLEAFNASGNPLSNPALEAAIADNADDQLRHLLQWSEHVNRDVKRFVHGVAPFPDLRPCLEKLSTSTDMMVVSSTPVEALRNEWKEHDIEKFVALICGQEMGSKKQVLATALPHYEKDRILMNGDAPGDRNAAKAHGALFFPVVPGDEEASWTRLLEEGIDRFLAGTYAGTYEEKLTAGFLARLPSDPPWDT